MMPHADFDSQILFFKEHLLKEIIIIKQLKTALPLHNECSFLSVQLNIFQEMLFYKFFNSKYF
jgi:hypothetical protein